MTCVTKVNQGNPHFHLLQNCTKPLTEVLLEIRKRYVSVYIIVCRTMQLIVSDYCS